MKEQFFRLMGDAGASLPQSAFQRIHGDELWRDLWTDRAFYDGAFKQVNRGFSLDFFDSGDFDDRFDFTLAQTPVFLGWFDLFAFTAMPSNDLGWTILSRDILAVFDHLGFIDARRVALPVVDRGIHSAFPVFGDQLEQLAEFKDSSVDLGWFSEFQLHSRFRLLSEESNTISPSPHYVIRKNLDTSEAPLIFRDPQLVSHLIVKSEVKEALLDAKIKGIRFTNPFDS